MKAISELKAIDLFCGIGGFHLACKENNIDVVWASEIDKFARTQYQLNHGLIPQGDITKINVEDIPEHDLLCAGFPCQAFSNAGKKMGLEDTRGTLFYEIARILDHHKTPYFLLENVPNLLSINNGEIIKVIQDVFQNLGYYLKIKILNAADFGLGQLRKRVFIVGFRDKEKYFNFSFPTAYDYRVVLKDILEEEVDEKYFVKNEKIFSYIEKKSTSLTSKFPSCKVDPLYATTLMARQYASWDGNYITDQKGFKNTSRQGERVWGEEGLFPTLTQNPEFVQVNRVAEALGGIQGYRVYSEDNQSIALCANGGGMARTGLYSVKDRIRKLTPRECARLQGFPESYKIECSDSQSYKQFGNAVPVPVVSAIIKNILKVI